MIVLDTNVLSALMQSQPEAIVVDWLDQQPAESIWTTAINVFEIRYGLHQLAHGQRRRSLEEAFTALIDEDLEVRVLASDTAAADHAARLAGERRREGRPVDMRDTNRRNLRSPQGHARSAQHAPLRGYPHSGRESLERTRRCPGPPLTKGKPVSRGRGLATEVLVLDAHREFAGAGETRPGQVVATFPQLLWISLSIRLAG